MKNIKIAAGIVGGVAVIIGGVYLAVLASKLKGEINSITSTDYPDKVNLKEDEENI